MDVFQNIEHIMTEKGLNWSDLSRLAGISRASINQIKRHGHPTLKTLERLAGALDVPVSLFFVGNR